MIKIKFRKIKKVKNDLQFDLNLIRLLKLSFDLNDGLHFENLLNRSIFKFSNEIRTEKKSLQIENLQTKLIKLKIYNVERFRT